MSEAEQSEVTVKDAIKIAKRYVVDMFADDGISNVGLEEVDYDEFDQIYKITVGFIRKWDKGISVSEVIDMLNPRPNISNRTFKLVHVSGQTGKVVKVVNRVM